MKILSTLFILVMLAVVGVALLPILTFGFALLLMGCIFFVWLLPILIIADSEKTTGAEKACWILAIIFLSWFAWIFYFFLAPLGEKPRYERHYYYYD